ncbi:MAG: hypothetical protein IJW48_04265 [Clostridia bacterium]|nr:hypothetical protein [Clostridia bacterium]
MAKSALAALIAHRAQRVDAAVTATAAPPVMSKITISDFHCTESYVYTSDCGARLTLRSLFSFL